MVEEQLDVVVVGPEHPGVTETTLLDFCLASQGTISVTCTRVGLSY